MALDFYLTNACDLACKFCFNPSKDDEREIPYEEACKVLEAAYRKGHRYISFTGGEPFLYCDIFRLVKFAHDLGFWIQILTHGGLLDKTIIEKLQCYWRVRFRISLDGGLATTNDFLRGEGAFEKSVTAIRELCQHGLNVGVGMTVSEHNLSEIPEIVSFCVNNRLSFIKFSPVVRLRKGKASSVTPLLHLQMLTSIIEQTIKFKNRVDFPSRSLNNISTDISVLTTRRCMAGKGFFGITSNNTLLPCPLLDEMPSNVTRPFISAESFDDLSMEMDSFFEGIRVKLKGTCAGCEFVNICCGGCLAEKLSFGRAVDDEQPVCTKNLLEAIAPKFNQSDFDLVLNSWSSYSRNSLENYNSFACMRQAPFWSINFKISDHWAESPARFN